MSVMANGWGSREKARLALKRLHAPKKDESIVAQSVSVQSEDEVPEAKSVSLSTDIKQIAGPKRSNVRLVKSFIIFLSFFLSSFFCGQMLCNFIFEFFLEHFEFCFPT